MQISSESLPPIFFGRNNKPHLSYTKGICNLAKYRSFVGIKGLVQMQNRWMPAKWKSRAGAPIWFCLNPPAFRWLWPEKSATNSRSLRKHIKGFLSGQFLPLNTLSLPAWLEPPALLRSKHSAHLLTTDPCWCQTARIFHFLSLLWLLVQISPCVLKGQLALNGNSTCTSLFPKICEYWRLTSCWVNLAAIVKEGHLPP